MRVQRLAPALIALMGLAGIAVPSVDAATNLNSSRSNIYRPISSAAGEGACIRAGGIVVVLQNRKKSCSIRALDGNPAAKQLCSHPEGSSSCCKAWGGTWVTGGSDGFCYRNL